MGKMSIAKKINIDTLLRTEKRLQYIYLNYCYIREVRRAMQYIAFKLDYKYIMKVHINLFLVLNFMSYSCLGFKLEFIFSFSNYISQRVFEIKRILYPCFLNSPFLIFSE